MDLKNFIKNVLEDVTGALADMQAADPKHLFRIGGDSPGSASSQTIDFDIAISVSTTDTTKGEVGIKVLEVLQGGGAVSSDYVNSKVSRVKFKINIHKI
jgi:hypothetical protein